jgi:hypothetical protein
VAATTAASATAAALAAAPAVTAAPATTSSVVGLGWTPENICTGRPAAASTAVTCAITGVAASTASVTMTTCSAPVARTTPGSFSTAPTPKCATGFGAMTNPSMSGI